MSDLFNISYKKDDFDSIRKAIVLKIRQITFFLMFLLCWVSVCADEVVEHQYTSVSMISLSSLKESTTSCHQSFQREIPFIDISCNIENIFNYFHNENNNHLLLKTPKKTKKDIDVKKIKKKNDFKSVQTTNALKKNQNFTNSFCIFNNYGIKKSWIYIVYGFV